MNKPHKHKRERYRRYGWIVNNPFTATAKEILFLDPDNLTEVQKQLYAKTQRDFSAFKTPQMAKYFDFALCEYDLKENKEVVGKVVADRIFFKSNELAQEYFKSIDFIEYLCYQVEVGEEGGLQHFQGFMRFKQPMDFEVVHSALPMLSLYICDGSNTDNRNYCTKEKTKDPNYEFYEQGEFKEEAQRSDVYDFNNDLYSGDDFMTLYEKRPNYVGNRVQSTKALVQEIRRKKFKDTKRPIHTVYLYGKPDTGKTTFLQRILNLKPSEICLASEYNTTGLFDEYETQDILLFDEFDSQVKLTKMNIYLDENPCNLYARYFNRTACFTKVFITSNYPLDHQYAKDRQDGATPSYHGFLRRVHEVIHLSSRNLYVWQKSIPTAETIAILTEQNIKYEIDIQPQFYGESEKEKLTADLDFMKQWIKGAK